MKRPAFQFYPGDWRNNAKLRRCSWAARGVWIELLGLLHDSDEYGVLRWSLKEMAQALGAPMRELNELVRNGVLYGCEKGQCEPMVYRPKSGHVEGAPVVLVAAQRGPIWYSPRMVRDEHVRTKRGASTRFGDGQGGAPKASPKVGFGDGQGGVPKPAPNHRQSDGASSSSSSSEIHSFEASPRCTERAGADGGALADDGPPEGWGVVSPGAASDAVARTVVQACVVLRKLGMRVQPAMPPLLALVGAGATVEQLALTASELALRKAGRWEAEGQHPELLERFASGATATQMGLHDTELAALKACAPSIQYLAATLQGRAADAQQREIADASHDRRAGAGAAHRHESAAERAERLCREGDERESTLG